MRERTNGAKPATAPAPTAAPTPTAIQTRLLTLCFSLATPGEMQPHPDEQGPAISPERRREAYDAVVRIMAQGLGLVVLLGLAACGGSDAQTPGQGGGQESGGAGPTGGGPPAGGAGGGGGDGGHGGALP